MTQHRKTIRTKTRNKTTQPSETRTAEDQTRTVQTGTAQASKDQTGLTRNSGATRAEQSGYPAPSKAQRARGSAGRNPDSKGGAAGPSADERADDNFGLGYSDADFAEPSGSDPDWLEDAVEVQEDARPMQAVSVPTPRTPTQGSMSERLLALAAPVLTPLGYELLEVQVQNPGRRPTVVVRIDRLDEQPVTTEDLSASSRAVGAEFDQQDPIAGEYRLEVESPGAKRPLNRPRHFERMLGLKARVRGEGHSFTAPIERVEGDLITFATDSGPVTLRAGSVQANLAEFLSEHR